MANQVVVKPTFLLRGINPYQLNQQYKTDTLTSLALQPKRVNSVNLAVNRGRSYRDSIFNFKNKTNFIQTVATTNARRFEIKSDREEAATYRCDYCHRDFKHQPIGVPVNAESVDDTIIIHTIRSTCDFRCSLGLIRQHQRQLSKCRQVNWTHAEQFLKLLYKRMYPEEPPLQPAPDPYLYDINGGSLSATEYHDPKYLYLPVPNIILYPAKEQYLRLIAK